MRAVNLLPPEARRSGVSPSLGQLGFGHAVLAVLVVALAFVTVYVLTSNTISDRTAQLASLKAQTAQIQAEAARFQNYSQFEQLAQKRAATVRQIAATRFDWHGALSDLSRVFPADASLQSLSATVGSSSPGGVAGGSGNVRADINAPAFQLKGCTGTQDEVAQLISRLRLINGVTRVTLEDSSAGAPGSAATVSSSGSSGGCPANGPSFDMTVFFQPLASSGTTGSGPPRRASSAS